MSEQRPGAPHVPTCQIWSGLNPDVPERRPPAERLHSQESLHSLC
jgi:hypothetical protein